jgi:hypothetical protein
MSKEMPVIPVNRVVDKKRIIRKNGEPIRRRGTQGVTDPKKECSRTCKKSPHGLGVVFEADGESLEDGVTGERQDGQEVPEIAADAVDVRVASDLVHIL